MEWGFTFLFSIEYAMRLLVVRRPWRYALSLWGVIDLLSILPTRAFLRWRRARRADPAWRVPEVEWRAARRWILVELHLLALIPLAAVVMARGLLRA